MVSTWTGSKTRWQPYAEVLSFAVSSSLTLRDKRNKKYINTCWRHHWDRLAVGGVEQTLPQVINQSSLRHHHEQRPLQRVEVLPSTPPRTLPRRRTRRSFHFFQVNVESVLAKPSYSAISEGRWRNSKTSRRFTLKGSLQHLLCASSWPLAEKIKSDVRKQFFRSRWNPPQRNLFLFTLTMFLTAWFLLPLDSKQLGVKSHSFVWPPPPNVRPQKVFTYPFVGSIPVLKCDETHSVVVVVVFVGNGPRAAGFYLIVTGWLSPVQGGGGGGEVEASHLRPSLLRTLLHFRTPELLVAELS